MILLIDVITAAVVVVWVVVVAAAVHVAAVLGIQIIALHRRTQWRRQRRRRGSINY